jgi:hypothetical protein
MIREALRERLWEYLPPLKETRRLLELALHRLPPSVTDREEEPGVSRIAEALGEYLLSLWYESIPEVEREIAIRLASITPLAAPHTRPEELAKALDAAVRILDLLPDSTVRSGCLRDVEILRREPDLLRARALHGRLTELLPPRMRAEGRQEALSRSVHRMSLPLKMLARELPRYLDFLEASGMDWPAASFGWNPREGRWDPPDWDALGELQALLSREPTVERLARVLSVSPGRRGSQPVDRDDPEPALDRRAPAAQATPVPNSPVEGIALSGPLSLEDRYLLTRRGEALAVARSSGGEEAMAPAGRGDGAGAGGLAGPEKTAGDAAARGTEREPSRETPPPMALVLDTTGSMRGEPESVAKALAFALLRHGVGRGRELRLFVFSTSVRSLALEPELPAIGELPRFLDRAFASGAAAMPALRQVLRQAQREGWTEGDILFVTDSREARLSPAAVEQLTELRRRSRLRLHGLSIHLAPMLNPENLFDFTWHYASSRTPRPGIGSEQFRQY